MMRNALGKDQGGSGVALVAEKYKESSDFWAAPEAIGQCKLALGAPCRLQTGREPVRISLAESIKCVGIA